MKKIRNDIDNPKATQNNMVENVLKQNRINFKKEAASTSMRPCRLLHAETLMKAKMAARADRHPIAICQQKIKKKNLKWNTYRRGIIMFKIASVCIFSILFVLHFLRH